MTSAFSWQNSISLCPASFRIPRPNMPVTPGVSWLPTFAFQSPIMKRTFLGVLVLEGLVGLIEPFNFSFFSITGWGIDLDYCDIEWFALEINRDPSVIFETASKYCILDSFVACNGYSISSKGFWPTIVDIMVIWVKFTHSSPLFHLSEITREREVKYDLIYIWNLRIKTKENDKFMKKKRAKKCWGKFG